MIKKLFAFIVLIILVSSCIPNEKVIYIQNKDDLDELGLDTLIVTPREEYELQPRDILSITFFSSVEEAVEPYRQVTSDVQVNLRGNRGGGSSGGSMGGLGGGSNNGINGPTFIIDNNGFLNVNTLEPIQTKGLSVKEVESYLEDKIKNDVGVLDIDVNVSLAGIRYTTIGEIGTGQQVIAGSEANILEAIAAAGDLTITADRQHIQIIRTYPDGVKIHEVDITKRNILQSKFFYVKPGDIIYAPPLKIREVGTGDNFTSQLGTIVSVLTSFLFIISIVKN